MSLYAYRILEEVAERGSFVKTAEALSLTPSAVSHAIAKLEEEFGFHVFKRSRGGTSLTENGERILPYIRAISHSNENLNQEINRIKNHDVGVVRIGLFASVASNWFISIFKDFKEKYPGIEVVMNQGGYEDIRTWLREKKVDLAFTTDRVAAGFDFVPLIKDNLICLAPASFVPKNEAFVTPEDFAHNNLIIHPECEAFDAKDFIEENGIHVGTYYDVIEHQTLFAMVGAGLGICIAPSMVAGEVPQDVKKLPILGSNWLSPYRTIGITLSEPQVVSPATELLKAEILEFLKE